MVFLIRNETQEEEPNVLLRNKLKIIDLPGDCNYRGKWIQYYNKVDCIIFVVNLNARVIFKNYIIFYFYQSGDLALGNKKGCIDQ